MISDSVFTNQIARIRFQSIRNFFLAHQVSEFPFNPFCLKKSAIEFHTIILKDFEPMLCDAYGVSGRVA